MRRLFFILLVALAAFAANLRLYLKDGSYHVVREYKVLADRVSYYSLERGDWEEIPLDLVDLKRTESEIREQAEERQKDAAAIQAEEKAEREQRRELARVPLEAGVYALIGEELKTIKAAESKVVNNKKRSILKAISPIPMISGKGTVEIDGEHAELSVASSRPEFYIRISAEQRFGIIRLTRQKGVRIVEKLTIVPISKEIIEEQLEVEIFRRQVDDGLYKIWPMKPLEPGEYAVVEYTQGKVNIQVWDFRVG